VTSVPTALGQRQVVHVIPYDGIGGVEVAAKSVRGGNYGGIEFQKYFLAAGDSGHGTSFEHHARYASQNDPRNFVRAVAWLVRRKPRLVIASLWRSCIVLLVVKLLRPGTRTVVFLHSAKDVHLLDALFTRMGMVIASEIWVDCEETRQSRVPARLLTRSRVISMLVDRVPAGPIGPVRPHFIFWGRLQAQKGLIRALRLFARIREGFPKAKFDVVGPDGGQRKRLGEEASRLGLADSVRFLGPMPREAIFDLSRQHSFYIQTSLTEGMAMAVVEAMQAGLVPVVAPVGEIARYCVDSVNAILVADDEAVPRRIGNLLADPQAYLRIAQAAQATWQEQPVYRESFLKACNEVLEREV
jgi:glycosyltransferase involved in cell wall biosynthesis